MTTGRIDPREKTWAVWKTVYKKAHAKARVKAHDTKGSDKFGEVNAAGRVLKTREVETNNGSGEVGNKALKGYFKNLAAVVINKKSVLENLVANNSKLASTNKDLVAMVKKLSNKIKNTERETSCFKKTGSSGASQGKRDLTLFPHCKKEGYHAPDACFELAKNKDKPPTGWKSWLWRCGTVRKAELSKSTIDKLLTHTANFIPTLDIST